MGNFLIFIILSLAFHYLASAASNKPALKQSTCKLFVFGDSNSDVGGLCAFNGMIPVPPPGHKPSCRASDGLLYTDFLCSGLGMKKFLSSYLEPLGSDFYHGADFAVAGATAVDGFLPLPTQIQQFARFQYRVRELRREGKGPEISEHDFANSIYTINIGQNDLTGPVLFAYNLTKMVTEVIPRVLHSIQNATRTLYNLGAKKIVLYNTGPIGCLPGMFWDSESRGLHKDEPGCLMEYNEVSKKFNDGMASMATRLRDEMKEATLVYIDMYSIKYDLFANASKYGFDWTLRPCLGGDRVCVDPSRAVSWDGIHYTQAANKIVASKIMAGHDSFPYTPLTQLCRKLESA